jgi:uncharacterized protein
MALQLADILQIFDNEEFRKRKRFIAHGKTSVFKHSIAVTEFAILRIAPFFRLTEDEKMSLVVACLLHDFYPKQWGKSPKITLLAYIKKLILRDMHGFQHGKWAVENAKLHFPVLMEDRKIVDAITHHMFPLTLPPSSRIGWILTIADKVVSIREISLNAQNFLELVGIKTRNNPKD